MTNMTKLQEKLGKLRQKPWRRLLIVAVLVCFFMFLSSSFWSNNNISVSFNADTSKDLTFQVFYTTQPKTNFSEKESMKQLVKAGSNKVVFKLPIKNIIKFRIDPGSNPGEVELSDITVSGNKVVNLDGGLWTYNSHIESHSVVDGVLTLISNQQDPYIIYKKELNLSEGREIDWCLFIISLAFSIFVSSVLVFYLSKFKILELRSRIEIVFLAVFFGLLLIPMSNISDAEKSIQENRMLAKFPSLYVNGQLNKAYGTDFEKWFNDRFAGRNLLINLYNRINALFNDIMDAEKVFQGQDEWLFYKGGGSIDNFQNAVLFKDKDLKNIASYLQNINDWSEKNNKKFYFIIAPDKNKIYGEYFPKMRKKRPDSQSRANQLINYLQKHTDVKVLYLYDVLMNNKDKGLLYYKNDTHWNALGAYYGYQEIINLIRSDFNNIPEVEIEGYKKTPHLKGDLTMMYPEPLQKEDNTQYNVPQFTDRMLCNPKQFASRSLVTCENRDLLLRAVVFRDSFTNILIPYFGQSFRKAQYIWRYDVRAEDVNFMQESDVILLIMVERSIVNLAGLKFNFNN